MPIRSIRAFGTVAAATLVAIGCQSNTTPVEESVAPVEASEFRTPPTSGADRGDPSLKTVYFELDSYVIGDEAKIALRNNAKTIKSDPSIGVITIEGHCDERGSEEYNLALGDRRAIGVKRYLVDLGVPEAKLTTVTYGETKPVVNGHDESAWRHNRRSELRTK